MSTAQTYTPQADSLAARVMQYFRRPPDEELSAKDIALKYNTEHGGVHTSLKSAVEHGMLVRDGIMYKAGPEIGAIELPAIKLATAPVNSAFSAGPKNTAAKTQRPPKTALSFETLKVETGIPPATAKVKGTDKWAPLFQRLTVPGQSIKLPADHRTAVHSAANKRNKAASGTWRVGLDAAGDLRVWRLK